MISAATAWARERNWLPTQTSQPSLAHVDRAVGRLHEWYGRGTAPDRWRRAWWPRRSMRSDSVAENHHHTPRLRLPLRRYFRRRSVESSDCVRTLVHKRSPARPRPSWRRPYMIGQSTQTASSRCTNLVDALTPPTPVLSSTLFELAAQDRTGGDSDRFSCLANFGVDAVDADAVDLGGRIELLRGRADQLEVLGILERRLFGGR